VFVDDDDDNDYDDDDDDDDYDDDDDDDDYDDNHDDDLILQLQTLIKVSEEDTIRELLDRVRAKMAIGHDEVLKIAVEGPAAFQPGQEEKVLHM
jgi:hypothetical protein